MSDVEYITDALEEWAGLDLAGVTEREGASQRRALREIVLSFVWTMSQDAEAHRVFQQLVREARSAR